MKILSAKLPLKLTTTKDLFCDTIIKWLKVNDSTYAVGKTFEEYEDKSEIRFINGYYTIETLSSSCSNTDFYAFRLTHIYYEQTWTTEIIYEESKEYKSVIFHINCSGDTTEFENVPNSRSEIIRKFLNSSIIASESLPILPCPIYTDFNQIDLYADIFNGKLKLPLPMVFISKILGSAGYEVDTEKLALQLAGIAFIVVENDAEFSLDLKKRVKIQVPFNGHIGILYPNGKIKKMSRNQDPWGKIEKRIISEIIKFVTAQVDKDAPTWEYFIASKAKQSEELLSDFMSEYNTLEERLKAAKDKITTLTIENDTLRNKNDSLQSALEASGKEEIIITKSPTIEFFDGEQHDLMVTILKDAANRCGGFDTRKFELINSLLENNHYIGNGRDIEKVVKRILSKGEIITKREVCELERVGFKLISDNPHYKFVYRKNERYWFTVSKTPSDKRSGINNASDIIRRLTVY